MQRKKKVLVKGICLQGGQCLNLSPRVTAPEHVLVPGREGGEGGRAVSALQHQHIGSWAGGIASCSHKKQLSHLPPYTACPCSSPCSSSLLSHPPDLSHSVKQRSTQTLMGANSQPCYQDCQRSIATRNKGRVRNSKSTGEESAAPLLAVLSCLTAPPVPGHPAPGCASSAQHLIRAGLLKWPSSSSCQARPC